MAHIKSISIFDWNTKDGSIRVHIALKPAGNVSIDVPIPKAFHSAIMSIAQTAADAHEAQMRAEILGDNQAGIDV